MGHTATGNSECDSAKPGERHKQSLRDVVAMALNEHNHAFPHNVACHKKCDAARTATCVAMIGGPGAVCCLVQYLENREYRTKSGCLTRIG